MAKCFLGIGKCSYLYIYILVTTASNYLLNKMFTNDFLVMNNHLIIKNIYKNIGYIIFGILFYYKQKKNLTKRETKNRNNNISVKSGKSIDLIYNNHLKLSKKKIFSIIIICLIYVIYNESRILFIYYNLTSLKFWTVHLFFSLFFMNRYFPKQIYKHQIYPMLFVIIYSTIDLILDSCIFFKNKDGKNLYQEKGVDKCILIILSFSIISILYSLSEVKIKKLIDFYYLSPYIIIIIIGVIGFSINFITSLIFDMIVENCNEPKKDNIICYGAISSYFYKLKEIFNGDAYHILFYFEILFITPLYIILEYIYMVCSLLIYESLNPCYLLFSNNIFYLISFLPTIKSDSKNILQVISNGTSLFFEFIGFCISLEIIELRFCGLNKNIRKNIILRAEFESMAQIDADDDEDNFINDDDKNMNELTFRNSIN